ncbi:L-asparaginase [Desulfitispora alkaliphila]|uniref:asparaginase n=1 Tax=Desulfitispora alkaliphila TaxID=622674 RepID=UPI003D1B3D10
MRKVVVITAGGTIAMTGADDELATPQLKAEDIVMTVPGIEKEADLTWINWRNKPSPQMSIGDIAELSELVTAQCETNIDGVVITHGTDTMEEVAYLLDLTSRKQGKPVVLTGAQRHPSMPSPDGPVNFADAVRVASSSLGGEQGVVVVFNGEIHSARDVEKTHTTRVDSFSSREFGPLGVVSNGNVYWYRKPVIVEEYPGGELHDQVFILNVNLGSNGYLLDELVERGARGIVLEALGGGHVPPEWMKSISRAINKRIPVVLSSSCRGRLLTSTYGYRGAEVDLINIGVIFGDGLPPKKARIKLIALLGAGYTEYEIKKRFEENFYN